jgi:glucosylglycerate phosphorylase
MRLQPWQVVWIKHKLKAPERLGRLRRWRMKLIKRTKRYTISIKRTMR